MALIHSHGISVSLYFGATLFVVMFFSDGEYQVKASEIFLANVGENITLQCSAGRFNGPIYWYRHREGLNREYIAAVDSVRDSGYIYPEMNNYPLSQLHEVDSSYYRSFTLGVYDVNIADSGNYTCNFKTNSRKTYDVRVMECTDCKSYPFSGSNPNRKIVNCGINNFHGSHLENEVNIMMDNNRNKTAFIGNDTLSFIISNARLYNGIYIEFNPYPESTNIGSNITCIIPPQPSTQPSSTASTMVITTHPRTSEKSSSPSTHSTPSPTTTSAEITTKKYQKSTSAMESSSYSSLDTKISTTSKQSVDMVDDINSNKISATVLIIAITVFAFIIILIVIIVIIRFKQAKGRQKSKSCHIDTNGHSADKAVPGERNYESIEEMSQKQPCELMDNILYESSDVMIERSASTSRDQMDTVLYTVPDKTGIINRVATSKVIYNPSDLQNPNGNNAQICDHEPTESKQGQENQYEDVAMTGQGRDDDIPLYAMPNKGPRSTENNPKSRPGTESQEDDCAEIPLYAMPDKRRK